MEYGLGRYLGRYIVRKPTAVLILLLMEYGLGQVISIMDTLTFAGLNPSFNGIWSRTFI